MKSIIFFLLINLFFINAFSQEVVCDNVQIQDAYNLAVNTVKINVRRGILAAGGDYGGEWTRDISINSWNGVSMLLPQVAYINMIHFGLAGIRMEKKGIRFSPYLPNDIHYLKLTDLHYGKSIITLIIKGKGRKIKDFTVNGIKQNQ